MLIPSRCQQWQQQRVVTVVCSSCHFSLCDRFEVYHLVLLSSYDVMVGGRIIEEVTCEWNMLCVLLSLQPALFQLKARQKAMTRYKPVLCCFLFALFLAGWLIRVGRIISSLFLIHNSRYWMFQSNFNLASLHCVYAVSLILINSVLPGRAACFPLVIRRAGKRQNS